MIQQLLLGSVLILISTLLSSLGFMVLEVALTRLQAWLLRPPHRVKLLILLCGAMVWILVNISVAVWFWAIALRLIGVFVTMEASVYFSIVSFTTLGFGDILLPTEWRILSGMAAVNGLVMIGLLTAMLVEVMRRTRAIQMGDRR